MYPSLPHPIPIVSLPPRFTQTSSPLSSFFFLIIKSFIKKKGYKDNNLTYIRWTSREKESTKVVAWNRGAQQMGEQKNHKKPTPPYWTFSIWSSKEVESSLSHKAILWRTIEKHIWRLGATLLQMMPFQ
jgi:hypothetical protein